MSSSGDGPETSGKAESRSNPNLPHGSDFTRQPADAEGATLCRSAPAAQVWQMGRHWAWTCTPQFTILLCTFQHGWLTGFRDHWGSENPSEGMNRKKTRTLTSMTSTCNTAAISHNRLSGNTLTSGPKSPAPLNGSQSGELLPWDRPLRWGREVVEQEAWSSTPPSCPLSLRGRLSMTSQHKLISQTHCGDKEYV
ncbi:unnamed protein product [Pleuronectes platessa]|uniref:Uncharacterized protein n=1 Tax=Pleuronectes platessa TaxID=8262 RepID=A0A9N7VI69_PLEPL|nr:unnamed protein product [Pleuronectes platessa]